MPWFNFKLKLLPVKRSFTKMSLVALLASASFIYSCSEKDPLPLSQANFRIASVAPEIDLPVKFENLSLNASVYAWDFGDGSKDSLVIAPEHIYTQPGSYLVKLTAYTEDGQRSEAIEEVKVGTRYLTGMFIINIPMTDPNGNPWDNDGTGPDVLFQLGPTDATTLDELSFVLIESLNVGQFQTPIGITTEDLVPQNYRLSNKEFFILLEEVDPENLEAEPRTMAEVVFNPVNPEDEFVTVTKRAGTTSGIIGTGDIVIPFIVLQEYQFYLEFVIR